MKKFHIIISFVLFQLSCANNSNLTTNGNYKGKSYSDDDDQKLKRIFNHLNKKYPNSKDRINILFKKIYDKKINQTFKIGDFKSSPLLIAISLRDRAAKDLAEILIKNGGDINTKYENNKNLLFYVANKEIAQILIYKGLNPKHIDNDGNTPLHYAKYRDIAELLVNNGADINAINNKEDTPLMHLFEYEDTFSIELTQFYIDNHFNINHQNNENKTLLDMFLDLDDDDIEEGDLEIFNRIKKLLLKNGAKSSISLKG